MSESDPQLFNSPLEVGLRALFLVNAAGRRSLDLQTLVSFDFALVHTDAFSGPPSLHPRTPSQGGELLVRRSVMQEGLELMRSRDLIDRQFKAAGIAYCRTPGGMHVGEQFDSPYAEDLRERAAWVIGNLGTLTPRQLEARLAPHARSLSDELILNEQALLSLEADA
jgi:hypothetical protein